MKRFFFWLLLRLLLLMLFFDDRWLYRTLLQLTATKATTYDATYRQQMAIWNATAATSYLNCYFQLPFSYWLWLTISRATSRTTETTTCYTDTTRSTTSIGTGASEQRWGRARSWIESERADAKKRKRAGSFYWSVWRRRRTRRTELVSLSHLNLQFDYWCVGGRPQSGQSNLNNCLNWCWSISDWIAIELTVSEERLNVTSIAEGFRLMRISIVIGYRRLLIPCKENVCVIYTFSASYSVTDGRQRAEDGRQLETFLLQRTIEMLDFYSNEWIRFNRCIRWLTFPIVHCEILSIEFRSVSTIQRMKLEFLLFFHFFFFFFFFYRESGRNTECPSGYPELFDWADRGGGGDVCAVEVVDVVDVVLLVQRWCWLTVVRKVTEGRGDGWPSADASLGRCGWKCCRRREWRRDARYYSAHGFSRHFGAAGHFRKHIRTRTHPPQNGTLFHRSTPSL